jgi:hypothetical protein
VSVAKGGTDGERNTTSTTNAACRKARGGIQFLARYVASDALYSHTLPESMFYARPIEYYLEKLIASHIDFVRSILERQSGHANNQISSEYGVIRFSANRLVDAGKLFNRGNSSSGQHHPFVGCTEGLPSTFGLPSTLAARLPKGQR